MLLAIISDIHANDLAFEACLAASRSLKADRLVLLGDLVGYGPAPEEVTRRAAELAAAGAITIKGNHDDAIEYPDASMNPAALAAIDWTRRRLSPKSMDFLSTRPLLAELDDVLFVHADASAPSRWNYVTNAAAAHRSLTATTYKVTFCGHVHVPQLYCLTATGKLVGHTPATGVDIPLPEQRQWLGVIGSAGQPRDGNPAAAFATYDTETRVVTYRRAPYDAETVAARIRAAGLPESLAVRLLVGR
jgi:diadenosine tetraphosphatase ApaH/serine/threonine PP2A family protein phosphatase